MNRFIGSAMVIKGVGVALILLSSGGTTAIGAKIINHSGAIVYDSMGRVKAQGQPAFTQTNPGVSFVLHSSA